MNRLTWPFYVRSGAWQPGRASAAGGSAMPGLNSGLDANDPVVVAAFRAALIHQGIIALLIFGLVSAVWAAARGRLGPARGTAARAAGQAAAWAAEPPMAAGLPSQVIRPEAASSPGWVQQVVNWGTTAWSDHPVQAAAAAVWIQVGIG